MTKETFTTGLFVLDATHVPSGCSLWPAWRFVKNINNWGVAEVDVIEGQNLYEYNQVTLHTTVSGCNQYGVCSTDMSGHSLLQPNTKSPIFPPPLENLCTTPAQQYQCPIGQTETPNLGRPFNTDGGGYALPLNPLLVEPLERLHLLTRRSPPLHRRAACTPWSAPTRT